MSSKDNPAEDPFALDNGIELEEHDGFLDNHPTKEEPLTSNEFLLPLRISLLTFGVILFSVIYFSSYSLFSLHPLFMTVFMLCCSEAIIQLQVPRTRPKSRQLVRFHQILHTLGVTSLFAGLLVILRNKNLLNKPHFTSWHGCLGLFLAVVYTMIGMFGLSLVYFPNLFGSTLKAKKYVKLHRRFGYLVLGVTWVVLGFGLASNWIWMNVSNGFVSLIWFSYLSVVVIFSWRIKKFWS
ncbi:hypothetical protein K493DRAFT_284410 [Basidiobolus meristosporus CBS 931.73]|uniref:Cytochrome b561 domain-containing protein n=1 Tax=Basidiobolus meristosporus CBS 931.73 TaxID=1314790 RepID=A0A1Y1Y6T9_9FUNG|nr:hypothetical protein K493DRAFT_284410 [Basidiobolus meristosporus CBS 931.73]|eukprot:ORX93722.1 hypothetical protein K493DRAFT_284410 [Basidiobolus meristosporus CBS 931.73]